jgi:hypothetical protein
MVASADGSGILSVHPNDTVDFASWLHWLGPAFVGDLCQIAVFLHHFE